MEFQLKVVNATTHSYSGLKIAAGVRRTAYPHRGTELGRHKPQSEHERGHHQPKADPVFN